MCERKETRVIGLAIKKYRTDVVVIVSLLLLSAIVLLAVFLTRQEGARVTVTVDGVTVGEYPLGVDGVYELRNGANVLTVEDGRAYMSYSSCPDHLCENTGRIKYVGETIVCLPNKVTVTVVGDDDGSGVDFVS